LNKIKTIEIIYIFYCELSEGEPEKYGMDYFIKLGYKVQVWYCYPLIFSKYTRVDNPSTNIQCKVIDSHKMLKKLLTELPTKTIIIDQIVGLSHITFREQRIFRLLKLFNKPFLKIAVAPTPTYISNNNNNIDKKSNLSIKVKKIIQKLFINNPLIALSSRVIQYIQNNTNFYPTPVKIFSCESDILDNYCSRNNIDKKNIVPINTFDYDAYLDFINDDKKNRDYDDRTCVFLDNYQVGDPLAGYLGWPIIDVENYYNSLNALFRKIEKELSLRVIIAAHPRSNNNNLNSELVEGRQITHGKTAELVARSKLVICHDTTSVSFPVLFKKPILIAATKDMNKFTMMNIAEVLGIEIIQMDDEETMDRLDLRKLILHNANYKNYLHKYVKSKKAIPEKKIWEIVEPEINKIMMLY